MPEVICREIENLADSATGLVRTLPVTDLSGVSRWGRLVMASGRPSRLADPCGEKKSSETNEPLRDSRC